MVSTSAMTFFTSWRDAVVALRVYSAFFRLPGDNVGHSCLSGAGGTVENEVGIGAVLDQAAQQRPLAQQVLLSGHIVKRLGAVSRLPADA